MKILNNYQEHEFKSINQGDLDLLEVSIIDDRKYPAYIGTSIEMRDDGVKIAEVIGKKYKSVI